MRRLLTSRTTSAAIVGVVVALAVGGGYAIGASSNTIHACATKGSGTLYIGKCKKHDKKLGWNKVGPQGPPGQQGQQGQQGLQGPQGIPGIVARAYIRDVTIMQEAVNISGFTHPSTGIYCLTPSNGVTKADHPMALVSVEWGHSSGNSLAAFVQDSASNCPAGNYEVRTYDFAGTLTDNVAFYIAVLA